MINELFTVCLLVNDYEKAISFYTEAIGLEVEDKNSLFASFKVNGTSLAVFEKSEAVSMFPKKYMHNGGGAVLAYQVDNLEKEVERLTKNDVKIFEGPKVTPWGQKVAYFLDPDKNIWEMSEPF